MTAVEHHPSVPDTMTVIEAAQALGVSKWTLYDLAKRSGELAPGIPFQRIGSCVRLPRERTLAYARGEWPPAEQVAS